MIKTIRQRITEEFQTIAEQNGCEFLLHYEAPNISIFYIMKDWELKCVIVLDRGQHDFQIDIRISKSRIEKFEIKMGEAEKIKSIFLAVRQILCTN